MFFGGLLVVALFAALIVPFFVDWTNYKQAFEREASRVIGQPVKVGGDASLRLLPLPGFSFSDLTIGRYDDGTAMMTVDRFSLTADLLPFLRGQMHIVDMSIESPQITVRVNDNGTVDWTARNRLVVDPDNVEIENMRITNATIHLDGITGERRIRGEQFSAKVSAQSLYGPWRIESKGLLKGETTFIDVSTGRLQEDGSLGVRTTTRRGDSPYRMYVDGSVSVEDQLLRWSGRFEVTDTGEQDDAGAGAMGLRGEGLFDATPEGADISEYRLEVGDPQDPYTITGSAAVDIGETVEFEMTANGRQVDLERLEPQQSSAGPGSLDERLSRLQGLVDRIPIPPARGNIRLTLPAIVAGDTVIRDFEARVRPDFTGWRFESLNAILPGDTLLAARGKLGTRDDFGFTGEMRLESDQPTGFAKWLSGQNNASLRRLRSAGFSAYVTVTGTQVTFEEMRLQLDDVELSGRLQRIPPVDGRGAIIADLSGEEINIDDLRAVYALTQSDPDAGSLTNHDLDIQISTGLLSGAGLSARDVEAHVRVESGSVSIDRLNAGDFYGATISSSGRLSDMLDQPSGDFGLEIEAESGAELNELAIRTFGENRVFNAWRQDPELVANIDLDLRLDARPEGEGSQGRLAVSGEIGGTKVTLRDSFVGNPRSWRLARHQISAKFEQPEPHRLVRQLSLPAMPVTTPGPLAVNAELTGKGDEGLRANFSAHSPGSDLTANGLVRLQDKSGADPDAAPVSGFDLDVTLGSQNIDNWLLMADYPLSNTGEGVPASLSLKAGKSGGVYRLDEIDGQYGGIAIGGALALDTDRPTRPKLTGSLGLDELSLYAIAEMVLGGRSLEMPEDPGAAIPFNAPDIEGLDIELAIESERAKLTPSRQVGNFVGELQIQDKTFSAREFGFDWLGGRIGGNLGVKNVSGNAFVNAQIKAEGFDVARAVELAGFGNMAEGVASLNASLDANGADLPQLLASMSGSGVLNGTSLRINGVSADGFDRILSETDREQFEIEPEAVDLVARKAMLDGSFAADEFSAPITVTGGEASLRNLSLADEAGELRIAAAYDLANRSATSSVVVAPDPGREALAAARPEVRFSWEGKPGEMSLETDSTPLESYISMRAFEREQRRVAIMQSNVLEKQRLRREVATTLDRIASRESEDAQLLREMQELQQEIIEENGDDGSIGDAPGGSGQSQDTGSLDNGGNTESDGTEIDPEPERASVDTPASIDEDADGTAIDGAVLPESPEITPTPRPAAEPRPQASAQQRNEPDEDSGSPAPQPNNLMKALERLFGN